MDDIGRLIRHTGGRDAVPEDRFDDAREKVQSHWQQVVAEHRRGRFQYTPIAVAASVVVAVIASALLLRPGDVPGPVVMASVDRVLGDVLIDGQAAAAGNIIEPGAVIETGDVSRVALCLADGQSLRLDTLSRIVVHTANEVSLETGGIYIDTEHSLDASPVLVMTALGQARDVGTQFQVRLAANVLIVGVRDGLVEVTRPDRATLSIDRGRVVELNTDGSESERDLQHDDAIWTWVETVAPDFDVNGATLEQYLSWYTGQRGLRLVWSDPGSEQKAKLILLTGSITGMTLQEGFETVQRIAPFEHRFEDDTIWVSMP